MAFLFIFTVTDMNGDALNNEAVLVEKIAQGDATAFRAVFDHYWDKIYSMALTYTKSSILADDIVQDVFVKIWRKRDLLPTVEKFDAYLFITARNELIDVLRKKVEHVPLEGHYDLREEGSMVPDAALSFKESEALVHEAISKLPPQQQRIYRLSRIEGRSQQEIASELGISVNTVKVHMNKALHFIRQHLSENTDKGHLLWLLVYAAIQS